MRYVNVIGTVGVPACYGGFESLVENLLDYTPDDVKYTVFCSSKKYDKRVDIYKNAKLVYINNKANGKESIIYDLKSMKLSLKANIMLILGVSGCIFLPFIRKNFKGKIITNIDGLEWKRTKWNFIIKWFLHYSEKQAVRYSDVIIGDNKGITDYVWDSYKKKAVLIAYGGDHVIKVKNDLLYKSYSFCKNKYAITVCRIEPENNVHIILEAFSKLENNSIVIVGNWNNSKYGRELKEKYSNIKNMHLLESIYDPEIINWLRGNAYVYIHGHSAGGTNPSLVEAMNFGLPILAYNCIYNRATTDNKCFYWSNCQELEYIMNIKTDSFSETGKKMHELGSKRYTWSTIAQQYNSLY